VSRAGDRPKLQRQAGDDFEVNRMRPHPEALYFHIARRALDGIEQETDEFQLAQRVGTAIVFSALTLEAFINQQFGQHPETIEVIKEERGISLPSKWILLPWLLGGGKTFARGAEPFQKFSELVRFRNTIFHFNPTGAVDNSKPHKQFFSSLMKDVELGKSYFNVVEKMIRKLHELTDGKTEIPGFLGGNEYLTTIWVDIAAPIEFTGSGTLVTDGTVMRAQPDTDTTDLADSP
jgi:hypothetical protein